MVDNVIEPAMHALFLTLVLILVLDALFHLVGCVLRGLFWMLIVILVLAAWH
jgi:hypothetical protein